MSMIGQYRRVDETTLKELLTLPQHLSGFLYPVVEDNPEASLDIDKSWHIIHFLLTGDTWAGRWPLVGAVMGGTTISDEDVGYGPARYLKPDEVAEVSHALTAISTRELLSRFDVNCVQDADIYPHAWSGNEEDREYIAYYYAELQTFFAKATAAGQAVILFLN